MTTAEPASRDDALPEPPDRDALDLDPDVIDLTAGDPMIVLRYEVLPRPLVGAYLIG